jgi:hypothetical protein
MLLCSNSSVESKKEGSVRPALTPVPATRLHVSDFFICVLYTGLDPFAFVDFFIGVLDLLVLQFVCNANHHQIGH